MYKLTSFEQEVPGILGHYSGEASSDKLSQINFLHKFSGKSVQDKSYQKLLSQGLIRKICF